MGRDLPAPLRSAIETLLEGRSRSDLARRAAAISGTYREGGGSAATIATRDDALAYAAVRLPATYTAVAEVLSETASRLDGFAPRTVLDVGAGPGTASFAAVAEWPAVETLTLVDASPLFLDLAAELAGGDPHPALRGAARIVADVTRASAALPAADLVVAAYALAEVPDGIAPLVTRLFAHCTGALVLVEPGTPAGYRRILAARSALIAAGATIAAPCPHAAPCPIVAPDWCHFSVRLPRRRDHMRVKEASLPFEDEKFAYVVAARGPVLPVKARVIAMPRTGKAGIDLKLCTAGGTIERRMVAKRDRAAYANVRRLRWGDVLDA